MLIALLLQAAACPATPAPLPRELAGWSHAMPVAATAAGSTVLMLGHGATATLLPPREVRRLVPNERRHANVTWDGVFAFDVPVPGRYRIALGAGAWVDVVRDGKALISATHGHGPSCSSVRKMVDFDLRSGRHQLQLVGSPTATIAIMVVRLR